MNAVARAVNALVGTQLRSATVYVSDRQVVRATRRCKPDRRAKREEFVLTIGAPNHRERIFLKACRKAGEPVPVRKVQLRFYPKARK